MNVTIANKTEEPLLSRVKVEGNVTFDNETPSQDQIKANIAKSEGKDAKLVDIEKIETAYGQKEASIVAFVYENEDMIQKASKLGKKKLEAIKKAEEDKKKAEEEAKKAAEEAKAKEAEEKEEASSEESSEQAPAEEKPAEEDKEEVKEEQKAEEKPAEEEKKE